MGVVFSMETEQVYAAPSSRAEQGSEFVELVRMLGDVVGQQHFGAFVHSTGRYSDCFAWAEVQHFKAIVTTDYRRCKARQVFNSFMSPWSLLPISDLNRRVVRRFGKLVGAADGRRLTRNMFSVIEFLSFCKMATIYAAFKKSQWYKPYRLAFNIPHPQVEPANFALIGVIGRCEHGIVLMAQKRTSRVLFAMKLQSKASLLAATAAGGVNAPALPFRLHIDSLRACEFTCVSAVQYAFETDRFYVRVSEIASGGTLRDRIDAARWPHRGSAAVAAKGAPRPEYIPPDMAEDMGGMGDVDEDEDDAFGGGGDEEEEEGGAAGSSRSGSGSGKRKRPASSSSSSSASASSSPGGRKTKMSKEERARVDQLEGYTDMHGGEALGEMATKHQILLASLNVTWGGMCADLRHQHLRNVGALRMYDAPIFPARFDVWTNPQAWAFARAMGATTHHELPALTLIANPHELTPPRQISITLSNVRIVPRKKARTLLSGFGHAPEALEPDMFSPRCKLQMKDGPARERCLLTPSGEDAHRGPEQRGTLTPDWTRESFLWYARDMCPGASDASVTLVIEVDSEKHALGAAVVELPLFLPRDSSGALEKEFDVELEVEASPRPGSAERRKRRREREREREQPQPHHGDDAFAIEAPPPRKQKKGRRSFSIGSSSVKSKVAKEKKRKGPPPMPKVTVMLHIVMSLSSGWRAPPVLPPMAAVAEAAAVASGADSPGGASSPESDSGGKSKKRRKGRKKKGAAVSPAVGESSEGERDSPLVSDGAAGLDEEGEVKKKMKKKKRKGKGKKKKSSPASSPDPTGSGEASGEEEDGSAPAALETATEPLLVDAPSPPLMGSAAKPEEEAVVEEENLVLRTPGDTATRIEPDEERKAIPSAMEPPVLNPTDDPDELRVALRYTGSRSDPVELVHWVKQHVRRMTLRGATRFSLDGIGGGAGPLSLRHYLRRHKRSLVLLGDPSNIATTAFELQLSGLFTPVEYIEGEADEENPSVPLAIVDTPVSKKVAALDILAFAGLRKYRGATRTLLLLQEDPVRKGQKLVTQYKGPPLATAVADWLGITWEGCLPRRPAFTPTANAVVMNAMAAEADPFSDRLEAASKVYELPNSDDEEDEGEDMEGENEEEGGEKGEGGLAVGDAEASAGEEEESEAAAPSEVKKKKPKRKRKSKRKKKGGDDAAGGEGGDSDGASEGGSKKGKKKKSKKPKSFNLQAGHLAPPLEDMTPLQEGERIWYAGIPESEVRLYAAELLVTLAHLHELGIGFNDLRADNILLDAEGHCQLTDTSHLRRLPPVRFGNGSRPKFDAIRPFTPKPEDNVKESEEMIAVEKISKDWKALGALFYEMLCGEQPDMLLEKPRALQFPMHVSKAAKRLVRGLFYGGWSAKRTRKAAFFKGIDWLKVRRMNHYTTQHAPQRYFVLLTTPSPPLPPLSLSSIDHGMRSIQACVASPKLVARQVPSPWPSRSLQPLPSSRRRYLHAPFDVRH